MYVWNICMCSTVCIHHCIVSKALWTLEYQSPLKYSSPSLIVTVLQRAFWLSPVSPRASYKKQQHSTSNHESTALNNSGNTHSARYTWARVQEVFSKLRVYLVSDFQTLNHTAKFIITWFKLVQFHFLYSSSHLCHYSLVNQVCIHWRPCSILFSFSFSTNI